MAVGLAVGAGAAVEPVALDAAGEAAAFADAGDVQMVAFLEDLRPDPFAHAMLAGIVHPELPQIAQVTLALQMASHGLVHVPRCAEAELNGAIAVPLLRLDLGDQAGSRLDDGGAAQPALLVEELDHPQLAAQQPFDHSLTSMSTPAGSWRRIRVSTVLEVGFWMSMMRLWVRISNCSRPSLWTKGERMTVNFLM
jgi:hypothetical protein